MATLGSLPSPAQERAAERIRGLRVFPSDYKLEWMEDPWDDVAASGRWLLDLKRQFDPDVIHLNTFAHAQLHWDAPVVLTAHWCVTSWWQESKGEDPPAVWDRYRTHVRDALRAADVVTAPSRTMAEALLLNYRLSEGQVRVLPHGRAATCPPQMKAGLILSTGHPWDEAKNVHGLARIAKDLPWPVCVAGPDQDPVGTRISLPDCMMLGQVSEEELAKWYPRTSIYALPARYAPFDYSILDAARAGCALVLGDIPSLRETWRGAAVFVPAGDPAVLRYTLRELIAQPRWRELMGLRAKTRAQMFTTSRMVEQYLALYSGVCEERAICAS